ncbi:MAG: tyrosine-protein kinase, partial [Actinomycetota bacterium]|nr:tyrosine-protein kinase [Actinomycetota bacterium]
MTEAQTGGTLALREYLTVLRTRRSVILITVLVLVVPVLMLSLLQTPVYAADAELLLQSRSSENLFDSNTGIRNDPARAVQNEIRIIESQPVRDLVRQRIGSAPEVSATPIVQTDLIRVTAESTDKQRAPAIANAYANAYIDYRRKQAVDDLLAASQEVQSKISDLQGQIAAAPPEQRTALVEAQALFKQKLDQ